MQDPSQGVDPRLLPHLHLLIIPNAPKQHKLSNDEAVHWLQKVPQLVKERPVSWQFIGPQSLGTMFFEWLHPNRTDKFPSDGFAWLDHEHAFERDISDHYVLDIVIAHCGMVPDGPPGAFMRTRYRVRPKMNIPSPFDPAFWLVHYSQADPQYQSVARSGNYQLRPDMIQSLHERRALQAQGLPQRKDFMLVDRGSWPQVIFPQQMGRGGPPPYPGRPGPGQPGQPPFGYPGPGAHAAGPPAKRARQTGPVPAGAVPAPPVSLYHDTELELLEDTSSGDYLDNISPATISRDRFKRHHLWLEEVFSSLYSPSQIAAEDLGFGLVGELGDLTKGLLNPPKRRDLQEQERKDPVAFYQDPQINASTVYKHLDSDQFVEFEKRVAEFVDARNREMDEMREKHAKIMSRVNKGKYYVDAEERLREAGLDSDKIESIVRDVELKTGISLSERPDVVCVQRGGLQEEEMPNPVMEPSVEANGLAKEIPVTINGAANGSISDFPLTEQQTTDSTLVTNNNSQNGSEGMDLDVPISALQDTLPAVVATAPEQSKVDAVVSELPPQAPIASTDPPTQHANVLTAPISEEVKASTPAADAPQNTDNPTNVTGGTSITPEDLMQGEPESMFDEADFSAFDGIENDFAAEGGTGDDGLLDFDNTFGNATGTTPPRES